MSYWAKNPNLVS